MPFVIARATAAAVALEVLVALSSGERSALQIAVATMVLAVITFLYCIIRIAKLGRLARAANAKAGRLATILGVDLDELDA